MKTNKKDTKKINLQVDKKDADYDQNKKILEALDKQLKKPKK